MNILNPQVDAPRELDKLMALDRSVQFTLGMTLGIYKGNTDELAFMSSSPEERAQRLREHLLYLDTNGWPSSGQMIPVTPVMPEPQPQEQPVQPPQESNMQPPQFPRPVIPSTVGQPMGQPAPQMGQPQMPTQAPYSPPPMGQPQFPQGFPQMPQMGQQGQPQMQPQGMPTGMPQMQAPQWQTPQQAPPQQAPLPSGRAPAVPSGTHPSGLDVVLTKIAEVQAANQKLLEAIHKQGSVNSALLQRVLGTIITVAQMQGCPMETLVSSVAQFGDDEHVKAFLQAISGGPTQGKG